MKKFVYRYCVACISAVTLLACAREIVPEETISVSPGPESITITINASNDSESRTMIGENGASFWTPGDKLEVIQFFHTNQQYHFQTSVPGAAESQPLESDDPVTVHQFSVTFPNYMYTFGEEESEWITYDHLADIEGHPGKKFLYQAFYPSETFNSYGYSWPVLHVPSRQRPLADSFDPLADILYSKPVYLESQPSTMDLSFKRFAALGIMTLTGIPDGISENAVVNSVEFISGITGHEHDLPPLQAPRTRANLYNCPPLTGDVYQEDYIFYPENGNWVHDNDWEYIITLDYLGKELKANGLKAYFTCWPTKFEEETCFTVKVTVDDNGQMKTYTRTVELGNRTLEFSSGVATTFSVNMESAEVSIVRPLSFSGWTLQYFPELNSAEPVIKYYNDGFNPYYPFDFTSDYEWDVEFTYDDSADEDWLAWGSIKSIYGGDLYSNRWSNHERRATMVFTCLDNLELSFEIPVEEHFIVQLKKDDVMVEQGSFLQLPEDESFYFTAVLDLPSWVNPESVDLDWRQSDNYFSITPDKDIELGFWVNGDYLGTNAYFDVTVSYDDIWGTSQIARTRCYIDVVSYHVPLLYNGEDVHDRFIVTSLGQPITLIADMTDLPESDIDKIEWIAAGDYEWDDDSHTYVGGSIITLDPSGSFPYYSVEVCGFESGYDDILLIVTLKDGTEIWSYCEIEVGLGLFLGTDNVLGKSVTLTPGTPITLSADISSDILNSIKFSQWINVSDYNWNDESELFVYVGGGTGLSISPHSEDSQSIDYYTVTVSCTADYDEDIIYLRLVLNDESEIFSYCFVNNDSGSKKKALKQSTSPSFRQNRESHRPRAH